MTSLVVTSLYDAAAEAYFPPIFAPSKGVAIRSFMDACSNPETAVAKHSEHFSLFHLGTFDTVTGSFDLLPVPEVIGKAWEMKQS